MNPTRASEHLFIYGTSRFDSLRKSQLCISNRIFPLSLQLLEKKFRCECLESSDTIKLAEIGTTPLAVPIQPGRSNQPNLNELYRIPR